MTTSHEIAMTGAGGKHAAGNSQSLGFVRPCLPLVARRTVRNRLCDGRRGAAGAHCGRLRHCRTVGSSGLCGALSVPDMPGLPISCARLGTVLAYMRDVLLLRARRYVGHNPAGGLMIVALLVMLAATCISGYMVTTDAYWGSKAMEEIHGALANATVALIVLHVLGVLVASFQHRENLVKAMVSGRKRFRSESRVAACNRYAHLACS